MVPTVCFWCSCASCILNCNICLSVLFAVPVNHGCANNMKKIRSCLLITFRLHCYGSNPIACATLYCRWLLLNSHFSNLDFISMVQLFHLFLDVVCLGRVDAPWRQYTSCQTISTSVQWNWNLVFFYIIWFSSHSLHSFGVKGYFLFLALLQCVDSSADLFLTFHQLIDGAVQHIVEPVTEY